MWLCRRNDVAAYREPRHLTNRGGAL